MNLQEAIAKAGKFQVPSSAKEAIKQQKYLKKFLRLEKFDVDSLKLIAAVDVSYDSKERTAKAGVCVYDVVNQKIVEQVYAVSSIAFPYVPGLLAYREIPAAFEALKKVSADVQLIICEGHGILHPRGFGLASHLGVFLNFPTMGIAKKRLFGVESGKVEFSDSFELSYLQNPKTSEDIGIAVRRITKGLRRLNPIFISPGNLITLKDCLSVYLKIAGKHRLPEPMTAAHRIAKSGQF